MTPIDLKEMLADIIKNDFGFVSVSQFNKLKTHQKSILKGIAHSIAFAKSKGEEILDVRDGFIYVDESAGSKMKLVEVLSGECDGLLQKVISRYEEYHSTFASSTRHYNTYLTILSLTP